MCVHRCDEDHLSVVILQLWEIIIRGSPRVAISAPTEACRLAMLRRFWCSMDRESWLLLGMWRRCSSFLVTLISCSNPVHFMGLKCTTANRCTPLWSISTAACSHWLQLVLKAFSEAWRVSLNHFLWPPQEHLTCWELSDGSMMTTGLITHISIQPNE